MSNAAYETWAETMVRMAERGERTATGRLVSQTTLRDIVRSSAVRDTIERAAALLG